MSQNIFLKMPRRRRETLFGITLQDLEQREFVHTQWSYPTFPMKPVSSILTIVGVTTLIVTSIPQPASAFGYWNPSSSTYQIQRSNGWSSGSYFGW